LHISQRLAILKRPVLVPVVDDAFSQFWPQAGNMGEQGWRGSVDIHAHCIDYALDDAI